MLEIQKIQLKELEVFAKSEVFQKFDIVPISQARIKSYLQNPRSKPNDVVLYLGFIKKELVAFRSLFADAVFESEESTRFGWCSGSWVRPGFRRKGYSLQLLKEAYSDWDGKLMLTNYSPESERLFVKTQLFQAIYQFHGVRCYLFPKIRKLVAASKKDRLIQLIFSTIDFLVQIFSNIRTSFFKLTVNPDFRFEELWFPDAECYSKIPLVNSDFLFQRGEKELRWIFENQWILINNESLRKRYPFSSFSDEFYYKTIKIFQQNILACFFIFSVREGHLKTLYFNNEKGFENLIALYLKEYCVKKKLEIATIYNSEVAGQLFKQKFPFLRGKKIGQKIYSTFAVHGEYKFQDGDGDVFFT